MSGRRIGNYSISDYLGGGGFGSVFKAQDASGRIVAIKELHKKHTRSPVIKQRFFQEAIAMAKLDHPNLPKLYTFGEDNGSYYLVMEFLSGRLLTDEIHEKKQLPLKQALHIIAQVLDALNYAHQQGIIHRDLKPDNIMLLGDGDQPDVKVLDFGIARMLGGENLTLAGEGFGTPVYMSPERIAGSLAPDSRADIYSLGIILYEMLSGQVPFQSKSSDPLIYWSEMRALHESQPIPPMNLDDLPDEVERIIKKATAKTVEYRYATANEMLADIRALSGNDTKAAVATKTAQLAITTSPPRASVYVDDILRGSSDEESGKFLMESLSPGSHGVRVTKTGYDEYQSNVILENDKRADLQVTLAARQTMMSPVSGDDTSPMAYQTARMESGEDEKKTAMLMLEGVPAGSRVFIGANAVALADEDGKATLNLIPGVHELEVRTPTGETGKRVVTLTDEDAGSKKTMAIPMTRAFGSQTTDEKPVIAPSVSGSRVEPSPTKKRAAAAAAVVLLTALAASSYFVFKGRNTSQPVASVTTQATPNAALSAGDSNEAAKATEEQTAAANEDKAKIEALQAEIDEMRRNQEKAQDKNKSKPDKATKEQPADKEPKNSPPANAVAPPPPVARAPVAPQTPSASSSATSCVGVRVFGLDGQPAAGARVMFIIFTGIPQTRQQRTNARGLALACDLPIGTKVMIRVPGVTMPQTVTVTEKNQALFMTLDRPLRSDRNNEPETGNRRNNQDGGDNITPPMPFKRGRDFPLRKRPPMF